MSGVALVILFVSCLVIWFAYAGYPVLLNLVVRLNGLRAESPALVSDEDAPTATVLLVVHNEEDTVLRKIANIFDQDYPADKLKMIVVSDGSTDDTNHRIHAACAQYPGLQTIANDQRTGKAACINQGMAQIDSDVVVLVDARQRLAPESVRALASHFSNQEVGAVSGELRLDDTTQWFGRGLSAYWEHEVRLRKLEGILHSVVGATGAIYAVRRAAFHPIPAGTVLDDVLIPMNVVLDGYRVQFESRAQAFDAPSEQISTERRRKIRTIAGNFQLLALRPSLLSPRRNPVILQFLSHKVARLVVPVAMLGMLASCLVLSFSLHWFFGLLLAGQLFGYAVGVLPESVKLGPLGKVRTFVIMHWFVVLGLVEFLSNREAHLWEISAAEDPDQN